MKIVVRYNRKDYNIEMPEDATVQQLKDEILKNLNVAVDAQTILSRGQQLTENDKKLSEYKIKNGSKCLLTVSESAPQPEPPKPVNPLAAMFNTARPPQPDKAIIDLGPPPGAMKNFLVEVSSLPSDSFVVRTHRGIGKLRFETEALFVEYNEKTEDSNDSSKLGVERIFPSEIQAYSIDQPEKGGYFHLCLLTTSGPRIFYFLPNQYLKEFKIAIENLKR